MWIKHTRAPLKIILMRLIPIVISAGIVIWIIARFVG